MTTAARTGNTEQVVTGLTNGSQPLVSWKPMRAKGTESTTATSAVCPITDRDGFESSGAEDIERGQLGRLFPN